jgi:glycosyltransferase involved in cell wall biosynthesis
MRRAKRLGAKTILYRACPHILSQRNLIEEEYRLCGLPLTSNINQCIVNKMLREYEESDLIVVPSSFTRDSFLAHGIPAEKLKINLLGAAQAPIQRCSPVDNGVFRALFVGGAVVRKGVKWLLEAWAKLDLPNAELVLRAPLNKELKALLKPYSQRDDIKVVAPVDDIYKLYQTASVFAFPSVEDGFGMVVTEAMTCGLPVIISENVGVKDVVRDGVDGFIVPIRDVAQVAEKLAYLYANPHIRHQMGMAAQKRVTEFTWAHLEARLIDIVEEFYLENKVTR